MMFSISSCRQSIAVALDGAISLMLSARPGFMGYLACAIWAISEFYHGRKLQFSSDWPTERRFRHFLGADRWQRAEIRNVFADLRLRTQNTVSQSLDTSSCVAFSSKQLGVGARAYSLERRPDARLRTGRIR
jgi:hypothetical protein